MTAEMDDTTIEKLRAGLEAIERGFMNAGDVRDLLALLPPKPEPEPETQPESWGLENLRAWLVTAKQAAIRRAEYPYAAALRDCISRLPREPKPEVPEGPWSYRLCDDGSCFIYDKDGVAIAEVPAVPFGSEPTAQLLASSWAAEELLREIHQAFRNCLEDSLRIVNYVMFADKIDRHFEEAGK